MPQITGENSLQFETKTNAEFKNYQALNNHAILKSFIWQNDLRKNTRFLDIKDFENLPQGQMINPVKFCYSHSSFEEIYQQIVKKSIWYLKTHKMQLKSLKNINKMD